MAGAGAGGLCGHQSVVLLLDPQREETLWTSTRLAPCSLRYPSTVWNERSSLTP